MRRITGVQIIVRKGDKRQSFGYSHRGIAMNNFALETVYTEWRKVFVAAKKAKRGTYIMLEIEREELPNG